MIAVFSGDEVFALSFAPGCQDDNGVTYSDYTFPTNDLVFSMVSGLPGTARDRDYTALTSCSSGRVVIVEDASGKIHTLTRHMEIIAELVASPQNYSFDDVANEFRAHGYGASVQSINPASCICKLSERQQ